MEMSRHSRYVVAGLFLLLWGAGTSFAAKPAGQEKKADKSKFLRLLRDENDKLLAMEAAVIRYVPKDVERKGLTVDLVGAVHVAEKGYYKQLNEMFEGYDVVLYELVAPRGARVPKGGPGATRSTMGALQNALKNMLNLKFQLEQIDYTKKNFVHADMSPAELAKSMRNRNESIMAMFLRVMAHGLEKQGKQKADASDLALLLALLDKNRAVKLKRIVAIQFQDMEGIVAAIDGPKGSTLISERNKTALSVLKAQIQAGKKRIAIFYGVGHLPDLHKRLQADFNLKPHLTTWLEVWNLR